MALLPRTSPESSTLRHEMGWLATSCGITSAIGYTLANVCLRSVTDLDPFWVSQVKAVPTVVCVAPLVVLRLLQGKPVIPSMRILSAMLVAAVLGQIGGNVAFQWSLGVIGIALCVPLTLGAMIVSGAILGWVVLGDRVSREMAIASSVLILAICILSLGAPQANASIQQVSTELSGSHTLRVLGAVAAACFSGFSYSCLGVVLRYASNRGTPISTLLLIVGLTGFLLLGTIVRVRLDGYPWDTLQGQTLIYLVAAGTFNVVAFAALTKALHVSSIVFVNALNASQTAMAAMIGVFFFGEAFSLALLAGVLLTVLGLLMMRTRTKRSSPSSPMTKSRR